MLGRIGETAMSQIPERGIGIAVIFGVEISVFDRHIEPFDGFDNQIEIEPLDRACRRVPGDGGCWRRVEVYEALDIFIIIIEQVDIGTDLQSPEVPLCFPADFIISDVFGRSEEQTHELKSLMRTSYHLY